MNKYLLQGSRDLFSEDSVERTLAKDLDVLNIKLESVLDKYMAAQKAVLQGGKHTEKGKKEELGKAFRECRDGIRGAMASEQAGLEKRLERAKAGLDAGEIELKDIASFSSETSALARQIDVVSRVQWYREYFTTALKTDTVTVKALIQSSLESGNIDEVAIILYALQTSPITLSLQIQTLDLPALISKFREKQDPEKYGGVQALEAVLRAFMASRNICLTQLEKTSGGSVGGMDADIKMVG